MVRKNGVEVCLEAVEDAIENATVSGNETRYLSEQSRARNALEDIRAFFLSYSPDSAHDGHEEEP